ncbi:hypothetical protein LRAMOSA09126 [Lichtheimia ramosa]|uniref:Uncharacterized protein n=1 Tax=Lichtheimia ramosa TaxID=688394 RepID=A0A077WHW4_9FUNG|nr:hypothetical protein LRAMOSA09126 [Lichtheimia ramosa]
MFATPRLVTHSFNWQCKRVIGDNLFGIQHSGRRAYTSSLNVKEKDQLHTGDRYASIPDRSLLEIQGPDTAKFLQGLITNNMPLIAQGGDGFFTSFLTPQGRMLYDAFIYPINDGKEFPQPKFMIECASTATTGLLKHLKRYILRSKVKVRDATEEYKLWSIWGSGLTTMNDNTRLSNIGCVDPRVPGFGYRAILPQDQDIQSLLSSKGDFKELPSSEYTIRRILHGIPEGVTDLVPEHALPLESNFDYMNGVNFNKGCYLGQELTIRTHHTGVVRKRIVPVQFYNKDESVPSTLQVDRASSFWPSPLESQMDVKRADGSSKRSVGKLGSGIHNIGLALMRLEHIKPEVQFTVPSANEMQLQPFIPEWWPKEEQH